MRLTMCRILKMPCIHLPNLFIFALNAEMTSYWILLLIFTAVCRALVLPLDSTTHPANITSPRPLWFTLPVGNPAITLSGSEGIPDRWPNPPFNLDVGGGIAITIEQVGPVISLCTQKNLRAKVLIDLARIHHSIHMEYPYKDPIRRDFSRSSGRVSISFSCATNFNLQKVEANLVVDKLWYMWSQDDPKPIVSSVVKKGGVTQATFTISIQQ